MSSTLVKQPLETLPERHHSHSMRCNQPAAQSQDGTSSLKCSINLICPDFGCRLSTVLTQGLHDQRRTTHLYKISKLANIQEISHTVFRLFILQRIIYLIRLIWPSVQWIKTALSRFSDERSAS